MTVRWDELAWPNATQMSASWYVPTGSMFSLRVPSKRSGDCGTIEIAERTDGVFVDLSSQGRKKHLQSCKPILDTSIPSMRIVPSAASRIRNKASRSDDLPPPVRPDTPIFWPAP